MNTAPLDFTTADGSTSHDDDPNLDSPGTSGVHAIAAYRGGSEVFGDGVGSQLEPAPSSGSFPSRAFPRSMLGVVGVAEGLVELFRVVDRIADTACSVLVTGESGTGKEVVARALHRFSGRTAAGFLTVNCGGVAESVLERELFGEVRGASSSPSPHTRGLFALAHGGTLFLDEVSALSLPLQVKLLRVLDTGEYSPIGGSQVLQADFRVVSATQSNLEACARSGAFREDLYYRLSGIHLSVPALRERPEDVPLLVQHFLARCREKRGRAGVTGVSRPSAQLLAEYHWPGNVRELENAIERAVLLCTSGLIEPGDLPQRLLGLGTEKRVAARLPEAGLDLRYAVDSFENQLIRQALERTKWNKKRAAGLLGLNRTTLVEMLKRKRIVPAA